MNTRKNKWKNYIGDQTPPPGYELVAMEHGIRTFYSATNVAYGANGHFLYKTGVIGSFTFSNETFGGDPAKNNDKGGFAEITAINATDIKSMKDQTAADVAAANPNSSGVVVDNSSTPSTTSSTTKWLIYGGLGLVAIIGGIFLFKKFKK
jgi:LPXTG-motif cell wall-anchored protein